MVKDKPELQEDQDKKPEINYQEDIHKVSLTDIAEDWAEEEEELAKGVSPDDQLSTKDASKSEDKSAEEKPKEPEVPAKEEVKEPEKPAIDEEKLTNNITEKILEKLAPEDATKEEKKDIKSKIAELTKKAADEGRELTYIEALEFLSGETKSTVKEELKVELKEELKKEIRADLEKEVQDEQAKQSQIEAQQKARQDQLNKEWDRQIAALEASKDLPKVVNMKDPNDEGVKEQMALLTQMSEYNKANPANPILNLVEFYHTKYKSPSKKPAGADAPVNGAKRSITPSDPNAYSYGEIHNTSLEDLARNGGL